MATKFSGRTKLIVERDQFLTSPNLAGSNGSAAEGVASAAAARKSLSVADGKKCRGVKLLSAQR
jgi:hypothetical protein